MKKYGILTLFHRNYNYGGFLQAFALQKFLINNQINAILLKYEYMTESKSAYPSKTALMSQYSLVELVKKFFEKIKCKLNYSNIYEFQRKKAINFEQFINDYLNTNNEILTYKDIRENVEQLDGYIIGSDQVWNPNVATDGFILKNVENIKKIAYAASIARENLTSNEKKAFECIGDFDCLSVREERAKIILESFIQKQVNVVLDPVFLLTKKQWQDFVGKSIVHERYALIYLFKPSQAYIDNIKKYCHQKNIKPIIIPYADGKFDKVEFSNREFHFVDNLGPREFVNLISFADVVFTDSFHGVAFSSIMNTNFMLFKRDKESSKTSKNSRLDNILNILGLKQRVVFIEEIFDKEPIDFTPVNKVIQQKREESINFLMRALCEENKND